MRQSLFVSISAGQHGAARLVSTLGLRLRFSALQHFSFRSLVDGIMRYGSMLSRVAVGCVVVLRSRSPWRSHREACSGCMVSVTTVIRSALKASRSVSLRSLAENDSSVLAASYFLR